MQAIRIVFAVLLFAELAACGRSPLMIDGRTAPAGPRRASVGGCEPLPCEELMGSDASPVGNVMATTGASQASGDTPSPSDTVCAQTPGT